MKISLVKYKRSAIFAVFLLIMLMLCGIGQVKNEPVTSHNTDGDIAAKENYDKRGEKQEAIEEGLAKIRDVINQTVDNNATLNSVNEMPNGSMLIVYSGKTSKCEIQMMRSERRKTKPWEINKLSCNKLNS